MTITKVTPEVIVEYLTRIRNEGLAANSMNRSLAALRGFYKYLLREKILTENPLANIELAKVWMKLPETISKEEMKINPGPARKSEQCRYPQCRHAGAFVCDGNPCVGINQPDHEQY